MLEVVLVGFAALIAVAATVVVLERAERAAWRRVATVRRRIWEGRRDHEDNRVR